MSLREVIKICFEISFAFMWRSGTVCFTHSYDGYPIRRYWSGVIEERKARKAWNRARRKAQDRGWKL